jgi:hypothetical protein
MNTKELVECEINKIERGYIRRYKKSRRSKKENGVAPVKISPDDKEAVSLVVLNRIARYYTKRKLYEQNKNFVIEGVDLEKRVISFD